MKKHFYSFLLLMCLSVSGKAAVGDTTWVQAHSDKWLDWFNNFDTAVTFPNGSTSYRKVIMNFTLGKYVCPGNPQYCSDWDYTVQVFLMTPAGDTFELGRLITPYANSARMPANWKQRYYFDVTDYASLLKNDATIRVHYSGYSGGFTANVKFAFIEGTPPRNVTGLHRLYHGSFNYGDPTNPIDNFLPQETRTVPAGTQSSELKFTVTGHGADGTGCSEFCSKYYTVALNGAQIAQTTMWRDNCGSNHIYPQNGTWIYDRANWCPGDQVQINSHALAGLTAGNPYNINVDFQAYNKVGNGSPSYIIESAVVYYGGMNRAVDAEITDVISPNNYEAHFRENAFCGNPVIKVKNTGSQAITSIRFQYDVAQMPTSYVWTGSIASLEEATVSLPEPWGLRTVSGTTATQNFMVKILEVNGQADEDASNNEVNVPFTPTPSWPTKVVVRIKTNQGTVGGVSETNWKIVEMTGAVVAQRNNMAPQTQYEDTVELGPSCYKLIVEDQGCDGLQWWANPNQGSGNFSVLRPNSPFGLALPGYFSGDFGCSFSQYFTTMWPTDVPAVFPANVRTTIEAVPNPAQTMVTVNLTGVSIENSVIRVVDAMGRVVLEQPCTQLSQQLNVSPLANGVYTIVYSDVKGKLQTKLLIAK